MKKQGYRWELFKREDGQFGIRFVAGNHKKEFTSGEGYHNRQDALDVLSLKNRWRMMHAPLLELDRDE